MSHDLEDEGFALPRGLELPLDDREGPARRIASARADRMIDDALSTWLGGGPAPSGGPAGGSGSRPTLRARAARSAFPRAIAATAIAVITGVGAFVAWSAREPDRASERPAAPVALAAPVVPAIQEVAPEPIAPPVVEIAEAPAVEEDVSPARRERQAEDLLARANGLRRESRWRDADTLYRRVATLYPGTFSAYVGDVASGDLSLDHLHDDRAAERAFRRAIRARSGGPLDAEARWGLARALRGLGDRDGERRALEALRDRHPGTTLGARASTRLGELDEGR